MRNILISIGLVAIVVIGSIGLLQLINRPEQATSPKVAATEFPLYDIVRNVAGEGVDVVLILEPGISPHTFDATPAQIRAISGSQAVFAIGHGLDNWAVPLATAAGVPEVITVDREITFLPATIEYHHDEAGEETTDEHTGAESVDPHYHLAIPNAIKISGQVRDELSRLFPDQAATFSANFDLYATDLAVAQDDLEATLAPVTQRDIATFHNAWQYFARSLNLRIVTVFEEFPGKESTPAYLAEFGQQIRENNVRVIFAEPQFSTAALEPIARDLGVRLSTLDEVGGVPGRMSYIELMRYNAAQIAKELAP